MKTIYSIIFALIIMNVKSQVGINTPRALANLEVHKSSLLTIPDGIIPPKTTADSLKLKDGLYGNAQDGTFIHITKPIESSSKKTQNITSSGYYIYDSDYLHADNTKGIWKKMFSDPSAFATRSISAIVLNPSDVSFFGSEFRTIQFNSAMAKEIGGEFIKKDQYFVPEAGLYAINYNLRFGNGITQQKESDNKPGIIVAKTAPSENKPEILDHYLFASTTLQSIATRVTLTEGRINHIYNLKAGEKLNFGIITGGLDVSALGDVFVEISIYKIR